MLRINHDGSAQLIGENSALERKMCRHAQRSHAATLSCVSVLGCFFSSCCCCATLHLRTFSNLLDLFLTSASSLFCLLFDLLFSPLCPVLVCNMLTLAQVDSSQFNGFLGSCLGEIKVFFKAAIKMTLTLWKHLVCNPKEQSGFYYVAHHNSQ